MLAIAVVNQLPAVLLRVCLEGFLLEILEGPVLAHGHDQIRHKLALPDVPLNGLGLHIHPAHIFHLGDHPGSLFLPVEDVHQLIIGGVHRIIDHGVRLLSLAIQIGLRLALAFLANHGAARMILLQLEQPVQRVGHIILAGVVHEVKNHQMILALCRAHPAAKLLRIQHL